MNAAKGGWEWQFGGWLGGISSFAAWSFFLALALGGVFLILFLYRHTLRELSPGRRKVLTSLRALVLLAVLLCLADPVHVLPEKRHPAHARTLAVLVDRSASMEAADNRGETRLANALRVWKRRASEMQGQFETVDFYRFGTRLAKAPSLEAAAGPDRPADGETHLYAALHQVLDTSPAEIVCLTDGLDTTGEEAAGIVAQAQQKGVPVDFVAGRNRLKPGESLGIREIQIPSRVLRNTVFTAGSILEINAAKAAEVPVELWSGPDRLAAATLPVRPGANVLPWTTPVKAGEPGAMPLEFRLGEGDRQQIAAGTTQVVGRTTVDVLYYQGALQWGYRFLLSALQSDPSFTLTSLLNPALHVRMAPARTGGSAALVDLPEDPEQLKRFQVVILTHVFANQLSPGQQDALVRYARAGGAVFFVTPDTAATAAFVGTPVEQMLPVVFAGTRPQTAGESAEQAFEEHMREIGGIQPSDESTRRMEYPVLSRFALPPGSAVGGKIFQPGSALPEFYEFAEVRGVKPGAEILAVRPPGSAADGSAAPRVLLARQRFGAGSTAVLTTDLLWRWKMALPSTSRAAETFWQHLMLSLASPPSGRGLRLTQKTGGPAAVNRALTVRVEGSPDGAPLLASVSPRGERKPLAAREMAGADGSVWEADFVPDAAGRWEVAATGPARARARLTIPVTAQTRTVETLNLPADVDGMRRLAEATGGTLIGDDDTGAAHGHADTDGTSAATTDQRHTVAAWDSRWLIALLLGVYAAELVLRRCFRLL